MIRQNGLSLVIVAGPLSGYNFAVSDMHFKPAHSELSSRQISKVPMIRTDNINKVRIFLHAQVVLNILKHDLNDCIAVRNFLCRETTAHCLF